MHILRNTLTHTMVFTVALTTSTFSQDWLDNFKGTWGIGASVLNSNYAQSDKEVTASPYIFGNFGDLWIEANRILYPIYTTTSYTLLATGNYRSHQYSEVLNKDRSIELGLTLDMPLDYGFTYRVAALVDVSNTHKGYELEAQVYRHDSIGKLSILSALSIQHQDEKLAQYYYGTDDYTPSSGHAFEAEFIATYPMGDFSVFAGMRSYWYSANIADSPLARSSNIVLSFFGVGYNF